MNQVLLGAIAMGFLMAGLFFLRYWYSTRDRFFLFFTFSFFIEAANRLNMGLNDAWNEGAPSYFMVRLVSFGLILFAIWDKNHS